MFKIFDGREYFYQWDIDRKLIVSDSSVEEVHFCNRFTNYSLVMNTYELEGVTVVDVPNIILQEGLDIHVYAYDEKYTKFDDVFKVKPRTRPADYVYTQEEIKVWDEMEQKVIHLEYLLGEKGIEEVIAEYFVENPVQPGASEAEVAQIEQNKTDIAQLQEAAATHATTEYVDEAIEAIPPVDFTGYATEEFVSRKIAEAQLEDAEADLNAYYTKSEVDAKVKETADAIPSIEGLASETYVDEAIAAIPPVDFTGYAKETYVDEAIAAIPPVDFTGYAKETYVDEAIAAIPPVSFEGYATEEYVGEQIAAIPPVSFEGYATEGYVDAAIEDIPEVDLSDYALKSELPSTVGLATEEYVNQQIEAIPDVDLTGYAKETYVDEKVGAIPAPDYSGLATEGYVDEKVGAIVIPEVPTKVSAFENDANYLTEHQSLENYYNKDEADAAISTAVGAIELPEVVIDNKAIMKNEDGALTTAIGGSYVDVIGETYGEATSINYTQEEGFTYVDILEGFSFSKDLDTTAGAGYWVEYKLNNEDIIYRIKVAYNYSSEYFHYFNIVEASEHFGGFLIQIYNGTYIPRLGNINTENFTINTDYVTYMRLVTPTERVWEPIAAGSIPVDGSTIGVNENNQLTVTLDTSGFATKEDIPEATDLSNYYTKEEVDTAIGEAGSDIDTSNFLKGLPADNLFSYQYLSKGVGVADDAYYNQLVIDDSKIVIVDNIETAFSTMVNENKAVRLNSGSANITQELLDAYGVELGYDIRNNKALTSVPIYVYYTNVLFILDKKLYITLKDGRDVAKRTINYFNRIWFDNTASGLSASDIPAAIRELAGKVPDISNYYTKEEVDSAILNAGSEGGGVDLSAFATKEEFKNSLYYNPDRIRPIVLSKTWGVGDTDNLKTSINVREKLASTEDEFWSYLKQGYMTAFTGSGSIAVTQEILDANGWTLGQDFINGNKISSVPLNVYGNSFETGVVLWVFNNTIHLLNNGSSMKTKENMVKYFNRIWFDNTTSGLTATDIPAAINELKTLIPDVSNYYNKTETDTAISDALAAIGIAEEGTY